ncbi:hypothetical protein GE061_013640 [Apolygus lucorum]|uniref:DUF7869 domain-containing protein n=1 Tax=Apolygus lucorum TaxID=248454 RepID=A0A8S9XPH1_APOLU|nr:hypothetical protein GE061_013640 [Apolygus lucorum]
MSSRSRKIVEMALKKAAAGEPDLDAICQSQTNQEDEPDSNNTENEIAFFSSGSSDLYEPSSEEESSDEENAMVTEDDFDHEEVVKSHGIIADVEDTNKNDSDQEGSSRMDTNEEHRENVSLGFELQKNDRAYARESNKACFVTMDLQQTMPLPKMTTNKAFYLRQMWFYNLGFHIISGSQKEFAVFCTWTENVANRGSDEICSSLLTLLEMVDTLKGKDHLIIWSDSCAGQNKNWQLICLYQLLIEKNVFKTIDHKYPEVGHTYLDSDRDFGRIEKVLRKHGNIYTPEKYREIISTASRNNVVLDMTNHFRDFTNLTSGLRLINKKKDLLGLKVPFRDLRWIRVEEYGSYLFKQSFLEFEPFRKVNILRNGATTSCEISSVQRLEEHAGILSEEKINDLQQQLLFVPEEFKWFYDKVIKGNDAKVRDGKTKKNSKRSRVMGAEEM